MNIGDRVKAKASWVDWHAKNIASLFAVRVGDGSGEREIRTENLNEVYFICYSKLGNIQPFGLITHYGAHDNDDNVDRKNVHVTFSINTYLGRIQYSSYVNEKDLEVVKKSKSKK